MNLSLIIISIVIIALVLLQSGKADGAGSAISGGSSDLFSNRKERGGELLISRLTMTIGMVFFIICLVLTWKV